MKLHKYKLLLVPLIILIMGMLSLSLMVLFQFRTFAEVSHIPLGRVIGMLIETTLSVVLFNYAVRWLNRKFPWNRSWILRVFLDLVLAVIMPLLVITFVSYGESAGWMHGKEHGENMRVFLYIIPVVTSSLFLVTVEMIISLEEMSNLEIKLAHIEKEQLNTKYSALKEQIDHHFLFNNLSVLSSLIYEDVEKADRFIHDFSSIYRYVLRINQSNLVSVKDELAFIDNYLQLYKFRFENGFDFKVQVNDDVMKYQIPPLTLQVLVENVIKHNVISNKRPLSILIENKGNDLLVRNTLQLKDDKEPSTKTGQSNLKEKYKLLESKPPEFKSEKGEYIAIVPLIKNKDDESINN